MVDRRTATSTGLALGVVLVVAIGLSLIARVIVDVDGGRRGDGESPAADRPELRFTAQRNWVSSPSGPVVVDGRYHLFFQHNPDDTTWGDIGWGHAVSDDQLEWEELDPAIPATEHTMALSGSVVVDSADSSGLCDAQPCLVAVYTSHTVGPPPDVGRQEQFVAHSTDGGRTWTQHPDNPVLRIDDVSAFRDPDVFWHDASSSWIMTVALPLDRMAQIYRSDDLLDWEHTSDIGPFDTVDGAWECPVLVELPVAGSDETRWMLKIDHNPGHLTGGSGSHYHLGDFDGREFVPDGDPAPDGGPAKVRWVDHGPDFTCARPFRSDPTAGPEPVTWLAWMSNWTYAETTPTDVWRGAMSIPRTLALREIDDELTLVQTPVAQLAARRGQHWQITSGDTGEASRALHGDDISGEVLELRLRIGAESSSATTRLRLRGDDGSITDVSFDAERSMVIVDRSLSSSDPFHPDYPAAFEAPVPPGEGLDLHIVLDRSSIEVFTGSATITALLFAPIGPKSVELETTAPTGPVTLDIWALVEHEADDVQDQDDADPVEDEDASAPS